MAMVMVPVSGSMVQFNNAVQHPFKFHGDQLAWQLKKGGGVLKITLFGHGIRKL